MDISDKNFNNILLEINKNLIIMNDRLTNIEIRISHLENKLDSDVIIECKKMGSHINFVENIYENVKQPLGFINTKIKQIIGSNTTYSLTNTHNTDNIDTDNTDNTDNTDTDNIDNTNNT